MNVYIQWFVRKEKIGPIIKMTKDVKRHKTNTSHMVFFTNKRFRFRIIQNGQTLGCIQKFPDWPPGARTAMVQLSATRCSCIAIMWVSIVSFAAITLCVASQRLFIVVSLYFVIDSVRKRLDTPSYTLGLALRKWVSFTHGVCPFSVLNWMGTS
jgi:hypothetical protein